MTCYTRHLTKYFPELGLTISKQNKKIIDNIVRDILNMHEARCPEIWKHLKVLLSEQDKEAIFLSEIKKRL